MYNVWIFPIISGYYFIYRFLYYKYRTQRFSNQRLLLHSILVGFFAFLIALAIRSIIKHFFPSWIPSIYEFLYEVLPVFHIPLLWTSVFTLLLSIAFVETINPLLNASWFRKIFKKLPSPTAWAIEKSGDELEQLFLDAAEKYHLVQVTLSNNKVYVGFIKNIAPPGETNYVQIIPAMSGYRESESKKLNMTINYVKTMAEFSKANELSVGTDIIIKQDEILTASKFDPDFYQQFGIIKQSRRKPTKRKKS